MTTLKEQSKKELSVNGKNYHYYSLPELEKLTGKPLSQLPCSVRVVLESVLRNSGTAAINDQHVQELAAYNASAPAKDEVPFVVSRIVLQDFTGVPLLVDIAAMRSAIAKLGQSPKKIEPLVPVDLVVDHSVQVDFSGSPDAMKKNLEKEFERNRERYEFLKWGQQAFDTFNVVPPGIGIVHQVNLEYLAQCVCEKDSVLYPDTLVGTDSHTTMINGLGVVGWGVGGIEAEAGMLGQPIYILTPEVIGVYLHGNLQEGVTATDLTLTLTEKLRAAKVVGKFVEFYGPGAEALSLPDRATIANMAPEYGATMGYFPVDETTLAYLRSTGRSEEQLQKVESYYKAQGLFGIPKGKKDIQYSDYLELDISAIQPSVAGPRRPQDRIELKNLSSKFKSLFDKKKIEGGFGKEKTNFDQSYTTETKKELQEGSVLISAITSCTNTSNPSVMVAAGLLAKKAVEKGLKVPDYVKTSLAPGSRVVTAYLTDSGLQSYLDQLGFQVVGYGCTTCIGNSGPLDADLESTVVDNNLVVASVLSGNRNFEARVHPSVRANFLMSPPLVVAYALAGNVNKDISKESLGQDQNGAEVYLKDLWPSMDEIRTTMEKSLRPEIFQQLYKDFEKQNPDWNNIKSVAGDLYEWDSKSTYIQEPPFFDGFSLDIPKIKPVANAKALLLLGDSVTTDHISPAGRFSADSSAGEYLVENGVAQKDFNSFGSRRGNDRVMTRGTFANVRVKNEMLDGVEGGYTLDLLDPAKPQVSIFDAANKYIEKNIPLVVLAGKEYGTGSSRDWAAKGTLLLGVKAVIAESFERIHRSNLLLMGVAPFCFEEGTNWKTLKVEIDDEFSIVGLDDNIKPMQKMELLIKKKDGSEKRAPITLRLDTPVEVEYYRHGGILPYVLRDICSGS